LIVFSNKKPARTNLVTPRCGAAGRLSRGKLAGETEGVVNLRAKNFINLQKVEVFLILVEYQYDFSKL
jgi:hypothetical protein